MAKRYERFTWAPKAATIEKLAEENPPREAEIDFWLDASAKELYTLAFRCNRTSKEKPGNI